MTARYGRSAFKPKRRRLSDRAFFVSRKPGAWLVVGENLCFSILLFVRFLSFFSPPFVFFPFFFPHFFPFSPHFPSFFFPFVVFGG